MDRHFSEEQHTELLEQIRDGFYGVQWDIQNAGREIAEAIRALPQDPESLGRAVARLPPWPPLHLQQAMASVGFGAKIKAPQTPERNERDRERVLSSIERSGSISHRDLLRKLTVFTSKELTGVISALTRDGKISVSEIKNDTNGKTTRVYSAMTTVRPNSDRSVVLSVLRAQSGMAIDRSSLTRRVNHVMKAETMGRVLDELVAESCVEQVAVEGGKRGRKKTAYRLVLAEAA